jgi:hypothetical protein
MTGVEPARPIDLAQGPGPRLSVHVFRHNPHEQRRPLQCAAADSLVVVFNPRDGLGIKLLQHIMKPAVNVANDRRR